MSAGIVVDVPAPAPASGPVVEVHGLHSPPDSNVKDPSDSELSDLDEDPPAPTHPDMGEIEPSYYSDDGVPVFVPSMDQFQDFTLFMKRINKYGMRSGIVKVIPPPEWKANQPRLDEAVKTIKVKEPIAQDIMGTSGTYRQANIVHQRSYNLPQWRQLCNQSDHQPPAKRGERRANQDKAPKAIPRSKSIATPPLGGPKIRVRGRPKKNVAGKDDEGPSTPDRLPTPVSPAMKAEDDNESVKIEQEDIDDTPLKGRMGSRQPKAVSVSARRKNNRRDAAGKIDEAAFKDFKYELEEEFPPERCEDLERAYWKTLTYAPPLYGADMPGSLFTDQTTTWNLGKLDNILDVMGSKIPGVNTAYLYLGMWKATFAWHLEDVDLYSINYLHFGAPKQWYSIAQGDARRFEAAMKTIWPADAKACDQFLRHKTFLISPSQLLSTYNIKVNKIVHHPGEFVITFPYGYHSGYNLGYNCAEAVNFGLEEWLEYGRVAKKCECDQAQDSVWINVHDLERKMRGEETEYEDETEEEEDEEDENENLLTPPDSTGDVKPKIPKKKRKRTVNDKGGTNNAKRLRIRIKAPSREPCILCPNDIPSEELLPTEEIGSKVHRICAIYIPETNVDEGIVTDVKYIDKARLDLKCNYCRSKKGACFQCSQKKCIRAYHATCAAAAGVAVQQGEIPVFGEDGTEYKEWGIEFSCRFHRNKRDKKYDGDALENDTRLRKAGAELKIGEICQAQYYRGDIFAGAVVENRPSEETVLIDMLPRGDRVEVEYKWLLIPDPADYHLPKPSANAIPMPKSRKDKQLLNTSKRHQADDTPRAEESFVQGHTWAEFKCEKIPKNPFQIKIDFAKDNQIWHYLGRGSTEAKAQYTEDLTKPRYNPKGNYLDTLPKAVPPPPPRQSYSATYPSTSGQYASNVQRPPIRPPMHAHPINKPEKPYVYKPRSTSDTYHIDPQAYRSQQNFLQRSAASAAPYSFGTDPRYKSAELNAQGQCVSQAPSPASSASPLAPPPVGPLAPPGQYRPPYPAPTLAKPSNPFNGRAPQSSRPNPFAKYPYLQKEHNRSPLEYKSPYRPGGGFMNGYQGSIGGLEKHLQQTLFQKSCVSTIPSPTYGGTHASYPRDQLSPNSTYGSTYSSYGTVSIANQQPPSGTHNISSQNGWEKKESSLHPAIRPEYQGSGAMSHRHYQSRQSPPQCQSSPVMQAPPSWDRSNYAHGQIPQTYHSAPPQYIQGYRHPAFSQGSQQPQLPPRMQYNDRGRLVISPEVPTKTWPANVYHQQQPQRTPPTSQQTPAEYNVSTPSQPAVPQYQTPIPQQPSGLISQQPSCNSVNSDRTQHSIQCEDQESKSSHSHQQSPQKLQIPALIFQPQAHGSCRYEPADVPVDSTSLVESMLAVLRKAR